MVEGEELRFTGNWFIDAGILGFVNLMEEVYGWNLKELQRRIREEPEKVYYGYFPLAYFYKLSGASGNNNSTILEATEFIEDFNGDKSQLLDTVWWIFITRIFEDKWINGKLKKMHKTEITDRKTGKPKPAFNDEKYIKYVEEREALLTELSCDEECQDTIKAILKKKEICKENRHNLELEHLEQLVQHVDQLPEKCQEKLRKALEVNEELKEHLKSQWVSLQEMPSKRADDELTSLKNKSRYFRIPVDSGFYKNFMFFNNSKGIFEQLEDFKNLIDGNVEYSEYLRKIDKTLSKFLPSDTEFPNVYYTSLRVEPLLRYTSRIFIYLLNFLSAFTFVKGVGQVFFYGSTLEFSYHVNKRLKVLLLQTSEKSSIFRITWQAVIDTLIEEKAQWSLENMYLVQFSRINQQNLVNVEYIGIPKLHASIILDDDIREALNIKLPTHIKDTSKNKPKEKLTLNDFEGEWVLETFLRNRPLFPLVIRHVSFYLSLGKLPYLTTSLYALAIDAKLKASSAETSVFGPAFFKRPKRAALEVKEYYRDMVQATWAIKEIFGNINGKNLVYPLLSAIRRHNRNAFVNILLKVLLQSKIKDKVTMINNYLFRRILSNDKSWEDFALALVVGLVGGGEDVSSGQSVVED
ncbi:hypothetical protein [Thermococcus sibiricus]|uniref:Uncharacterized protein n=1 Tax=Thermococcus sibiricus TaxID=172049 RepID=A0A101EKQ7_9EURY|nr:hypothetical protein [Thermococcus sibiricus]KUK16982.1 MAG: hypothetical protein XD54_1719 [Thermococcus sibiricus]